jgi:formylglycine-generating enzyme required for sulfatase activity
VSETGIGSTSAVGVFPTGALPYGCQDMIGNVWEWTQSKWKDYPYRADDGREELGGNDGRVLRGGAWHDGASRVARCARRFRLYPQYRYGDVGLRVVVAPNSRF